MQLIISGLEVELQKKPILRDLNLTAEDGQFLSLLGPSGCGKSTLLKTIAGILPMQAGLLTLGGRDISRLPVHRRGTVIVFQDMRLFPNMSVEENVAFPLKMRGVDRRKRLATAAELLERVQLGAYGQRRVSELSGGQQQRVALIRALAAKPSLLLLDEPFTALDQNLREDMRAMVLELHREFQMTTILVTHDHKEALAMADQVAVMFDGHIAQCGTPHEVYGRPVDRRTADYFGGCGYLPGNVAGGVFSSAALSCPAAVPNGRYDLLVHSSALHFEESGPLSLRVAGVRFQGAETLVQLEFPGGTHLMKPFPEVPGWSIGQRISCSVDCTDPVLFPVDK